jgi:DnaJ domain
MRDLERKVLAAAFKLSFQKGDTVGAALVHKGLCAILQQQLYDGDGSSNGAVIPASVWNGPQRAESAIRKLPEFASESKADAVLEPMSAVAAGSNQNTSEENPRIKSVSALSPEQLYETVNTTTDHPILTDAELEGCGIEIARASSLSRAEPELADLPAQADSDTDPRTESQPAVATAAENKPAAMTTFDQLQPSGILDPAEIEEAFAVMDMPIVVTELPEPSNATASPASKSAEPTPKSSLSGGEISAALERLTAAMPVDASASQSTPEKATSSNHHVDDDAPVPPALPRSIKAPDQPIALPVVEATFFEAPPPHLELNGRDAALVLPAPVPPAQPEAVAVAPANDPGPMAYLDFEGPQPFVPPAPDFGDEDEEKTSLSQEAIAEMFQQAETSQNINALQAPPMMMTPSQLIRTQSFYQILGVNKLSSYEEIHRKFFRLARRMLKTRHAEQNPVRNVREFREVLKHICVAHDILRDPVTRTDYDLRQLGMRKGDGRLETPADVPEGSVPRTRLMIGELLEIANILDRTELQIALDMHKAEPGTMFGTFLVKAGFLNPEELDSALLGQRLISSGKITVAQYQTAMFRMRDHSISFFDTLMVEGWLTPADMLTESADLWPAKLAGPAGVAPDACEESAHENSPDTGNGSATMEDAPENGGSNGHNKEDQAAMVAAAMRAESELLKTLEGAEDAND